MKELGRVADELLGSYEKKPAWTVPLQNEIDDIWEEFQELTRPYWGATYDEYKQGVKREFPGWDALGG